MEIWVFIVGAIVLLVVYGIVSAKLKARRQRVAREKLLPYIEETVRIGQRYNVLLSDGRSYRDVELLGTNDPASGAFALGGWDGMLVLKQSTGKRLFVRQTSVRAIEER
ncbi:MAG: hypothetical protein LBE62_15085 [Azonexus sp.]|nr:hypothetical protein [Azonexus sp.]